MNKKRDENEEDQLHSSQSESDESVDEPNIKQLKEDVDQNKMAQSSGRKRNLKSQNENENENEQDGERKKPKTE